jgi:(2Fe-2S) ferredoxin
LRGNCQVKVIKYSKDPWNRLPTGMNYCSRIARVGLISHIGGHKFAGNVILYFPPGLKGKDGNRHALAGCGIWYGRVEPRHVDGILKETLGNGKVVEEMFRGGIRQGGEILRL